LHVGQLARLMSQAMRKLTAAISKSNCVAIFINQIREKIGVMYGNPETTPGGRALKFYSSVRIEVRKGEVIKSGTDIIGASTRCKIVKNKVAPPFKECEFDLMYGSGISRTGEVLDLAVDLDIIKKGGSWFSYKDQKLGQGRDNVKELLKNDEALMKEIEEQILARKDELKESVAPKAKKGKKDGAEDAPAEENAAPQNDSSDDILADIDEDFEEFTPAEE
ncbi:MAG TPA: DNA recombination/repair protein RecA, partial [Ruminococcus flavefaciens]|nr:DNA recombination/repair protein RecA [Ruminococcus flavefaciens]